jgi:hypothetical protein
MFFFEKLYIVEVDGFIMDVFHKCEETSHEFACEVFLGGDIERKNRS